MTEQEQILKLREELHQHNCNYYVLNMPTISDKDFDMMMHQLQDLEKLQRQLSWQSQGGIAELSLHVLMDVELVLVHQSYARYTQGLILLFHSY